MFSLLFHLRIITGLGYPSEFLFLCKNQWSMIFFLPLILRNYEAKKENVTLAQGERDKYPLGLVSDFQ